MHEPEYKYRDPPVPEDPHEVHTVALLHVKQEIEQSKHVKLLVGAY